MTSALPRGRFESHGDRVFGLVNGALVALVVVSALYPFLYVAAVSLSSGRAMTQGHVVLWPVEPTLAAWAHVVADRQFWIAYANTIFYAVFGTAATLLLVVPGAYALSRPRLIGRRFFNLMVAVTMWFHAGMIPFFLNMRDLGLIDSRLGILIGFACNGFNVMLLRNAFENVPKPFEEAARIDGADEFQLMWNVFVPLARPTIVTVMLLSLVNRWNGYFWAMVLLRSEDKIPLQVYLKKTIVDLRADDAVAAQLAHATYSFETLIAAIVVASIVPVLIVFPWLQRHLARGMTVGGIKE